VVDSAVTIVSLLLIEWASRYIPLPVLLMGLAPGPFIGLAALRRNRR